MKLPELEHPEKYASLYVFDFGNDQVAVGYTADEIAVLLESEKHRDGKVYRIHRAQPDGTLELEGVSRRRFELEDGIFFKASSEDAARRDFDAFCRMAEQTAPPCRMKAQLARVNGATYPHLTAIIFPAEFTQAVSDWLLHEEFDGGEFVDGGPSQVTGYYESSPVILERRQLWPASSRSRPADEVLATTHLAIQRIPA